MDLEWYITERDDNRTSLPVIVFDGDDTLWRTEALYDDARRRAASIVAGAGLDPERFEELQRRIDVDNVKRFGLSSRRFPTSSREAYQALAEQSALPPQPEVADAVFRAAAAVFTVAAPMAPSARSTLTTLRARHRLIVLTKGDPAVQRRRLDDSDLALLLDGACIVEDKDPSVFAAVLRARQAEPATSWSVGNSYGSDIRPAVSIGMRAVWIDAEVWAHETSRSSHVDDHPHVYIAHDLDELPALIDGGPLSAEL